MAPQKTFLKKQEEFSVALSKNLKMEKQHSVKKINQKVTVHSPEVKKRFLKELRYRMNPRKGILFKSRPCATFLII